MASPLASSPTIEQLHCSRPTGRISWIILGSILFVSYFIRCSKEETVGVGWTPSSGHDSGLTCRLCSPYTGLEVGSAQSHERNRCRRAHSEHRQDLSHGGSDPQPADA